MSEPPPPYTPTAEQPRGHQFSTEQTPILVAVYAEPLDFGENPAVLKCPYCSHSIVTSTRYENGKYAYLVSTGICAVGLIIPLLWAGYCLLPFFLTGCQDVEHRCPECYRYLGHFRRF